MKTLLALALSFLSISCYAQECISLWDLKAKGFTLGQTREVLKVNSEKNIHLTSDFTPNAALKILGIESVKRIINLDKNHKLIFRQESIGKGLKITTTTWKHLEGNIYERHGDNDTEKVIVGESPRP